MRFGLAILQSFGGLKDGARRGGYQGWSKASDTFSTLGWDWLAFFWGSKGCDMGWSEGVIFAVVVEGAAHGTFRPGFQAVLG